MSVFGDWVSLFGQSSIVRSDKKLMGGIDDGRFNVYVYVCVRGRRGSDKGGKRGLVIKSEGWCHSLLGARWRLGLRKGWSALIPAKEENEWTSFDESP